MEGQFTMAGDFKTFQQYSQARTQQDNAKIKPQKIPAEYQKLIDKYPDLLKTDFHAETPKHGVVHNIDTGNSRPCTAKVRPLITANSNKH